MSIFGGYFDESGLHEGGTLGASPVVVMGGFVAKTEQWAMFSDEWQAVLDRHNIDCFHMTDFNSGQKQFKGMKDNEKDILIDQLIRVITIRARVGIIAYFHVEDYRAVINEMPESYIVKPYAVCSLACMDMVRRWASERGYTEPIPYVFDRGARYSGEFNVAYNLHLKDYAAASQEFLLGTFALEDKKRFKPLQAADVLAYWSYRRNYNKVAETPIPIKYPLLKLLDMPIAEEQIDKETIRLIFKSAN